MFCKKCGRQIDDNSKFCIYCGASLYELKPTDPFADFASNEEKVENKMGRTEGKTEETTEQPPVQPEPPVQAVPPFQSDDPQKRFIVTPQPQQPYEYNYVPPVPKDDRKLNAFSISGLIISIIGLLLCVDGLTDVNTVGLVYGLFAVTGLVLSIVGFIKSKEYKSGKILGLVGIVIGAIAVVLWIILLILVIITPYLVNF